MREHVCVCAIHFSTAAEVGRPIKGPDERLTRRAQLGFPIQTLTYAALGCSRGEGQADGARPGKVVSTAVCVCVCVCVRWWVGGTVRA